MVSTAIVSKSKRARKRGGKQATSEDPVGKYASDAWSLAKRTAAGLNEIRKLINIETKFVDTVQVSTNINTTGGMFPISEIAQGLTSANRIGDSIKLQHIEVRGRINVNPAATNSLVRVLIVRDLDGYGSAPSNALVLEINAAVSAPLSPEKFNMRERFSILYDELFAVSSVLSSGAASIPFYYSTAHAGHVLYLGTTAAAASDGKGSLYVCCVSDEGTNTPSLAFVSRILFTDD